MYMVKLIILGALGLWTFFQLVAVSQNFGAALMMPYKAKKMAKVIEVVQPPETETPRPAGGHIVAEYQEGDSSIKIERGLFNSAGPTKYHDSKVGDTVEVIVKSSKGADGTFRDFYWSGISTGIFVFGGVTILFGMALRFL